MRMKRRIKSALKYIPLCLAGLFFLVPFIWLISTSLKSSDQIFSYPPKWIPKPAKFSNYREAFEAIPYLKYILNTMKTTSLAVLGNVLSAPMIGYAFGKLKWPGRCV